MSPTQDMSMSMRSNITGAVNDNSINNAPFSSSGAAASAVHGMGITGTSVDEASMLQDGDTAAKVAATHFLDMSTASSLLAHESLGKEDINLKVAVEPVQQTSCISFRSLLIDSDKIHLQEKIELASASSTNAANVNSDNSPVLATGSGNGGMSLSHHAMMKTAQH